eukprot:1716536-Alexandrium_andersonii.AAC.1
MACNSEPLLIPWANGHGAVTSAWLAPFAEIEGLEMHPFSRVALGSVRQAALSECTSVYIYTDGSADSAAINPCTWALVVVGRTAAGEFVAVGWLAGVITSEQAKDLDLGPPTNNTADLF